METGEAKSANLEEMGIDDFTPYSFDREPIWVFFPLISFILVLWHLKDLRPRLTGQKLRLNTTDLQTDIPPNLAPPKEEGHS